MTALLFARLLVLAILVESVVIVLEIFAGVRL